MLRRDIVVVDDDDDEGVDDIDVVTILFFVRQLPWDCVLVQTGELGVDFFSGIGLTIMRGI